MLMAWHTSATALHASYHEHTNRTNRVDSCCATVFARRATTWQGVRMVLLLAHKHRVVLLQHDVYRLAYVVVTMCVDRLYWS